MFDFIKKFFGVTSETESKEEKEDALDPKELLQSLQPQMDKIAGDCIRITTSKTPPPTLKSSKFGGVPYFPVGQALPKSKDGKFMRLLAQINFAELPSMSSYPSKGLLQFYLAENDNLMGLDLDNPTSQENWHVLYFEQSDFEARTDLDTLFSGTWEESPLLAAPLSLQFEVGKDYPSYPSLEYYQSVRPLLKEAVKGDENQLDFLEDAYLDKELNIGHKIGGFPFYTQNEVREIKPEFADYQLLFQMDTDKDKIMWGDMGVGNFFIRRADLLKRDFSKVLYNWDCH